MYTETLEYDLIEAIQVIKDSYGFLSKDFNPDSTCTCGRCVAVLKLKGYLEEIS